MTVEQRGGVVRRGLFDEQVARKPNQYPWTQKIIETMWHSFWTPTQFDFKADYAQFKSEMTPAEQEIIVRALSAIGQIEIAVKRFWGRLGENLPHPSMSDLGYVMANTEVIHNISYEKLLETLRINDVFEKNLSEPVIKNRVEYLGRHSKQVYDDKRKQFVYAIILFTLFVENVSLFSQFYIVLWFNRYRNLLKDTAQQVQYTRNEEMVHAQVGIMLIATLREEYPDLFDAELFHRIQDECAVAYRAECALIKWMVGDYSEGSLSVETLIEFTRKRFNESLVAVGLEPMFELNNSIIETTMWMDEEAFGNNITDFFHKKPVDYAKHNRAFQHEDLF